MSGKKYALKRLAPSDLTIFRYHYERSATRQKAINLDKKIFLGQDLYPALHDPILKHGHVVNLAILLSGPGDRKSISLHQKIMLQQKNVRIGAAIIDAPSDDPDRFSGLAKNDFALIAFQGEKAPTNALICLLARNEPIDRPIIDSILLKYGNVFNSNKAMKVLSRTN
ncbi:MAG: hypothetical protein P8171_22865 [Candidatus Thiodiazotropha sp.]